MLMLTLGRAGHLRAYKNDLSHDTAMPLDFNATVSNALKTLDYMFDGHAKDPFHIQVSLSDAKDEIMTKTGELLAATYGELLPESIVKILQSVGAKPGMRYYDLGSGFGKTVAMAYMLGLDATGVELVHQRWDGACKALDKLKEASPQEHGPGLRNIQSSFLEVDFTDADIVFTDSVMFSEKLLQSMADIAKKMKPGTKIVSFKGLPGSEFKELQYIQGPTTWSKESQWNIQEVLPSVYNMQLRDKSNSNFGSQQTQKEGVCAM